MDDMAEPRARPPQRFIVHPNGLLGWVVWDVLKDRPHVGGFLSRDLAEARAAMLNGWLAGREFSE